MVDWPKKMSTATNVLKRTNLPVLARSALPSTQFSGQPGGFQKKKLPNASVVYGVAASLFLVVAIYTFFRGAILDGMLIALLAACFLGFAVHYIRSR